MSPLESPFIIHTVLLGRVAVCSPQGWGPSAHQLFTRALLLLFPLHPAHNSGTISKQGHLSGPEELVSLLPGSGSAHQEGGAQMWPQRDFNKDMWPPLPTPRPHPGQPAEVSGASAHQRDQLASFCSLLSSTSRCWATSDPGCLWRRGPSGGLSGWRTGLRSAGPDLPTATCFPTAALACCVAGLSQGGQVPQERQGVPAPTPAFVLGLQAFINLPRRPEPPGPAQTAGS